MYWWHWCAIFCCCTCSYAIILLIFLGKLGGGLRGSFNICKFNIDNRQVFYLNVLLFSVLLVITYWWWEVCANMYFSCYVCSSLCSCATKKSICAGVKSSSAPQCNVSPPVLLAASHSVLLSSPSARSPCKRRGGLFNFSPSAREVRVRGNLQVYRTDVEGRPAWRSPARRGSAAPARAAGGSERRRQRQVC